MSEGQHRARVVVAADGKSAERGFAQLARENKQLQAQIDALSAALAKAEKANDRAATSTSRLTKEQREAARAARAQQAAQQAAQAASSNATAQAAADASRAQVAAAQTAADGARRAREMTDGSTKASTAQRLTAIKREELARLQQIAVEMRGAKSIAEAYALQNRAQQVQHEAHMARMRVQQSAAKSAAMPVGGVGSLSGGVTGLAGAGGAAAGAVGAVLALDKLSNEAMRFENLSANIPFSLDAAREATKGLVSEVDLMKQAIAANRLGVAKSAEEFARLAGVSTKLGLSMGVDATQSLDNLVNGLGRASTEVLDNIGIVMKAEDAHKIYADRMGKTVGALTDLEKRQAVMTIGLERGEAAAAKVTLKTDTMAASLQRLKVEAINAAYAVFTFDESVRDLSEETLKTLGMTGKQAASTVDIFTESVKSSALNFFTGGIYGATTAYDSFTEAADKGTVATKRGAEGVSNLSRFLHENKTFADRTAAAWRMLGNGIDESMAQARHATALGQRDLADLENLYRYDLEQRRRAAAEKEEKEATKLNNERRKKAEEAQARALALRKAEASFNIASAQRELVDVQRAYERRLASYEDLRDAVVSLQGAQMELAAIEYEGARTRVEALDAGAALADREAESRRDLVDLAEQEAQAERDRTAALWEGVQAGQARAQSDMRRRQALEAAASNRAAAPRRRTLAQGLGIDAGPMSQESAQAQLDMGAEHARAEELRVLRQAQLDEERAYQQMRAADEATRVEATAELRRLDDEQSQLHHEAQLERLRERTWAENEAFQREQERLATRRQILQDGTAFGLAQGELAVRSAMSIAKTERSARRAAMDAARKDGKSQAEIAQAGADAARSARGNALIALGEELQGQAVGYVFKGIASGIALDPVGAATNAAAAAVMFGGAAAVKARGRQLAGSGASDTGDGGGAAAGGAGGGPVTNPLATGRSANDFPGSRRPPSPGNPAGGPSAPSVIDPGRGDRTITVNFNAPMVDDRTVREIRDTMDRLGFEG